MLSLMLGVRCWQPTLLTPVRLDPIAKLTLDLLAQLSADPSTKLSLYRFSIDG